jgi:choline dehydrogenase
VRLAGTDPLRPPVIDPNFLSDEADLELAIESLRQGRSIMAEPAMARFIAAERLPDGEDLSTRDGRIGFIRRNIRTACHPVGTCAMGVSADSVVDPELRVQGIANLRVADSSVMPALISGNTQAPTTMIAERAADLVLERNR